MRLSRKLWLTVLGPLLALLLVTQWSQQRLRASEGEVARQLERQQSLVSQVSAWITLSQGSSNASVAALASHEPMVQLLMQQRLQSSRAAGDALEAGVQQAMSTAADRRAMADILQQRERVKALLREGAELKREDPPAVLRFVQQQLLPAVQKRQEAMQALLALQQAQGEAIRQASADRLRRAHWLESGSIVAVVLLSLAWVTLLLRTIERPLAEAVSLAEAVAAGRLSDAAARARADEIGRLQQAMAHMSRRLRTVVDEVRQGVRSVATASSQIAAGNQDLSTRTERSASHLQQTVASLEQLSGTVAETAAVAQQARERAESAAGAARQGRVVAGDMVERMGSISASSRRIGDIIGVIDGLAFQTNILALNAAVEAARAGEQGRGFAVVAGEVRALAQRSAAAAQEIKRLITQSVEQVAQGAALVTQAGGSMSEVAAEIQGLSELVQRISTASGEQRRGVAQIVQAVAQVDQATQQNAALVEQSAAATASLQGQAEQLVQAVAIFQLAGEVPAAVIEETTA